MQEENSHAVPHRCRCRRLHSCRAAQGRLGPGESPACFKPWDAKTKHFQRAAKKGSYRIVLANGFVGNTWPLGMNAVAQGLIVLHTGGFAPQDRATEAMHLIGTGHSLLGLPNAVLLWLLVGGAAMFLLQRTTLRRAIYAVGNRERAAYLSGVDTRRVALLCLIIAGACSGAAGVLLTGYSNKAYQAMGDAYLLPAIAAVVLGGTNILGGSGSYMGTVVGVILITLLQSILSVMQMPEMGRQVIYGVVIIAMLLVYGRGQRMSD